MSESNGNPADVDVITSAGADSLAAAADRRKRLAAIDLELAEHRAEVKALSRERGELEERVLDDLAELGSDSMRTELAGGVKRTVYIYADLRGGPPKSGEKDGEPVSTDEDWERANAALREAGLDYLVQERFNNSSLSAWLREFRDEHGPGWKDQLPEPVRDVLRIDDRKKIKTVKAAAS